jgi:uncharacterized protein
MNRLSQETSPYLLQHAANPVDWYPWGEDALRRARDEDRPLLLSIGYAACHWCHVMERESFEDALTARVMNERFVCVKVDREERPDLDAVYMDAVVALTGQGGWPMTVFLTPAGEPFFGGTYFPPEPRHGLPSFKQVLLAVSEAWQERREDVLGTGAGLAEHLREGSRLEPSAEELGPELLDRAVESLQTLHDRELGGFGRAPKFPPASALELLLRMGDDATVRRTLDAMAAGGMHDLVGGGFHRYSVDARWLVPHFEKMLYDNALLASLYLHAATSLGDPRYRRIADRTLDFMLAELAVDGGGLASSLDADTEGVEGLTYTWERGDVDDALLVPFEGGRFIVRGELDDETRARLATVRARRSQPPRDDKVITAWNGLALAALAQGGRVEAATRLATFLLGPLSTAEGRLHRTWRGGVAKGTGYLEDYADVAHGLMELHVATGDPSYLREAHRLALLAVDLFADTELGGFFQAPADAEQLVVRKKDIDDHPTPSGSSMLAYVLLRLARIWGDDELERLGLSALRLVRDAMVRTPVSLPFALVALHQQLAPRRELAIAGDPTAPVALRYVADAAPTDVIAFGPADGIPLLTGRHEVDGRTAVYVCERFACALPVTD